MGYQCKIVADSISPQGHRITSLLVTYPRIVHAEFLRHRMLSRNSASSRAIPFEKMVKMVEEDPFIPIAWQKDHKGMQGTEYWDKEESDKMNLEWLQARNKAIYQARMLHYAGVTKQLCNRLLEPFMWHTELITATEWNNFFELRCPKYGNAEQGYYRSKKDALKYLQNKRVDISNLLTSTNIEWQSINISQAEIHIQAIAEMIWDTMNESTPKQLESGQWHIPFGDQMNDEYIQEELTEELPRFEQRYRSFIEAKLKIATARCARLSYMTFDGEIDYEKDIQLHDRLLKSGHFSCFEHCARAMTSYEYETYTKGRLMLDEGGSLEATSPGLFGWCNNFREWIPYRYLIENE